MYAWWVLGKGGCSASVSRQHYERSLVMNESFNGKVALVTGAGSGMGLATAKAFAEAGASVVLADIQEEAVRAAAEQLIADGRKALAIRCDVSDDGQVASMIERTVSSFGRLDAAFNNAGVMQLWTGGLSRCQARRARP